MLSLTMSLAAADSAATNQTAQMTQISVFEISGSGIDKAMLVSTTEMFAKSLAKTGYFQVTERERLGAILKDRGLDQVAVIPDSDAISVGESAGAQVVALSTLTLTDRVYKLSVRVLNVQTGEIDATASANAATNKLPIACNTISTELKERLTALALANAKKDSVVHLTDERGTPIKKKPSLVTLYLGNRFFLGNSLDSAGNMDIGNDSAASGARDFATTNMIRPDETIYKGTGTLATTSSGFQVEPTLRIGWEIPIQKAPFLSLQFSLEGGIASSRNLVSGEGNFRYQNPQANNAALLDVTYSGTLTASQQRSYILPMAGIGFELSNASLQKAGGMRFLANIGLGVAFQSYKRTYDLTLTPQYISAGTYSDTYAIKSSMTQSYSMAPLAAGRVDLGVRFNIGHGLHLALVGSVTAFYMFSFMPITYDNYGYFAEQAGANKITFQKITASSTDETGYFELLPAVFLALSREL